MSKKSKMNLKAGAIFLALTFGLLAAITGAIKADNKFSVRHSPEVPQTVHPDGRYTAGSPEIYQVKISKALVWKLSRNNTAGWRAAGIIILIAAAVFLTCYANGVINWSGNYFYALLVAAFGCYIGAYSSASENNFRELTKEQYEAAKSDKKALEALFTDKDYIR